MEGENGLFFNTLGRVLEKNRRVRLKNQRSRELSFVRKSTSFFPRNFPRKKLNSEKKFF